MNVSLPPDAQSSLQALRGLAAISVLLHHSLKTIAGANSAGFIADRVINPHAAVVFFFVLSGFVLSLSLMKADISLQSTGMFLLRRIFRIFPALWIGVSFGVGYFVLSGHFDRVALSDWAAAQYSHETTTSWMLIGSFFGIKTNLLPVLWTIRVELVAALCLPVFVLVFSLRKTWVSGLFLAALVILSLTHHKPIPIYLVDFAFGSFLAVNLKTARQFPMPRWSVAVIILVLLFFSRLGAWDYHDSVPAIVEALASVALVLAVCQGRLSVLVSPTLRHLGDWSYSIYLLHMPIALALSLPADWFISAGVDPDVIAVSIAALTTIISTGLSALVYRAIELPAIELSRDLCERLGQERKRKAVA